MPIWFFALSFLQSGRSLSKTCTDVYYLTLQLLRLCRDQKNRRPESQEIIFLLVSGGRGVNKHQAFYIMLLLCSIDSWQGGELSIIWLKRLERIHSQLSTKVTASSKVSAYPRTFFNILVASACSREGRTKMRLEQKSVGEPLVPSKTDNKVGYELACGLVSDNDILH